MNYPCPEVEKGSLSSRPENEQYFFDDSSSEEPSFYMASKYSEMNVSRKPVTERHAQLLERLVSLSALIRQQQNTMTCKRENLRHLEAKQPRV